MDHLLPAGDYGNSPVGRQGTFPTTAGVIFCFGFHLCFPPSYPRVLRLTLATRAAGQYVACVSFKIMNNIHILRTIKGVHHMNLIAREWRRLRCSRGLNFPYALTKTTALPLDTQLSWVNPEPIPVSMCQCKCIRLVLCSHKITLYRPEFGVYTQTKTEDSHSLDSNPV